MEPGRTGGRAPRSTSTALEAPAPGTAALLRPFLGLRYREDVVGPLDAVVAPPHTEIDRAEREQALAASPYLVTHLERPEYAGADVSGAPAVVQWLRRGALVQDPPALYVLQQVHGGRTHRFLVGELHVGTGTDDRVFPHEATIEDAVVSRAARLEAVGVDSEPVLLVDAGAVPGADPRHVGDVLAGAAGDPGRLGDHVAHADGPRGPIDVWRLEEPEVVAILCAAVGARRWIIGDGHHRWVAVRRTAARSQRSGAVLAALHLPGPAPLDVLALHRLAPRWAVLQLLTAPGTVRSPARPVEQVDELLASLHEPDALVLDGATVVVLRTPGAVANAVGTAAWVDEVLARAGVPEPEVRYESDTLRAVAAATQGMAAVLLPGPRWQDITAIITSGRLMGRKATSYRPKPIAGAVLRLR
ncbi:DUF1015 family protein [Kineococcus indalonis]|uniref:DUF1015 family protein n=1 Tax=Kineococcus indalonis TaxID=2696566 RepID=UPI0014131289|nr:DUF1015 family protein [Kineococcus indalonis]NAZ87935.1 DUF1015 family protein [Kineococcus indalonis]